MSKVRTPRGIGEPEQAVERAPLAQAPVPISSKVISTPVLPSFRLGSVVALAASFWHAGAVAAPAGGGRGQGTGLEENATVGARWAGRRTSPRTPRWADGR